MSDRVIRFVVRGLPVAQGSARAFIAGKRAIIATGAGRGPLHAWRTAIAQEARAAADDWVLQGPVAVKVTFVFPRPQSHFLPSNSKRFERLLRVAAPMWHIGPPDLDKLARASFDALTGVLWNDDRQVAHVDASKVYETPLRPPGAVIEVQPL